MPEQLQLRLERQRNPVADEVSALIAVIRPILAGTLYALKGDVVREVGGHERISLAMLARIYRRGDGDCGICFEYAVHDALRRNEASVVERVSDALTRHCHVDGHATTSILFGAEKSGRLELIETAANLLNDDSSLLYGSRGRPVKLKKHIFSVAVAFRNKEARVLLPQSISGLWKADLFVGNSDSDRWVGTSVKINEGSLESARGLRIGIIPAREGRGDNVRRDDNRNMVICPLPYDHAFMETFYRGFGLVQQFLKADAYVPREVALPVQADRQVARELANRRDFPVIDVIDVLDAMAQPELLDTREYNANVVQAVAGAANIGAAVTPIPTLSGRGRRRH